MKLLSSIPTAVKVGGAGVLGGGGIAGTGLLINNQIQKSEIASSEQTETTSNKESEEIYKLTEVDKALIADSTAVFGTVDSTGKFVIGDKEGEKNQVSLKVKVTTAVDDAKYKDGKWSCTIKGVAGEGNVVDLSKDNKFEIPAQTDRFSTKFSDKKEGFVKSCSRNRTIDTKVLSENLESTLTLKLKESEGKWIFNETDVTKVLEGNWVNA